MKTIPELPKPKQARQYRVFNDDCFVGVIEKGITKAGCTRWVFRPDNTFGGSGKVFLNDVVETLTHLDALDGN